MRNNVTKTMIRKYLERTKSKQDKIIQFFLTFAKLFLFLVHKTTIRLPDFIEVKLIASFYKSKLPNY